MRILMLTCHPGIRGPFPKILPLMARALRDLGCHVVEEPWGRHHEEETRRRKILDRPGDILRVRRRLKSEPFDVLFLHTTTEWANYSRDLPVLALCRKLVKKVVLQFHGSVPSLVLGEGQAAFKWASRRLFNSVDGVFVLSTEEQRAWTQFHPAGNFPVISNPFEPLPGVAVNDTKPSWKVATDEPVVLFVGRLIQEKGIYDLLEAVALARARQPMRLVLAGGGPEENNFRERVRALGLEAHVTLAGYLDAMALSAAYAAADVFVLPSWSEGFPTVLTEAMHAGLPVVTTRIRGAVDHLQDGVHARFVAPRAPGELAAALAEVLQSPGLRAAMGAANRRKVAEFAPEVAGKRILAELEKICGTGGVAVRADGARMTEISSRSAA
jgi:glycosyltransferase involved in cell wall biosynthesis